MAKAKSTIKLHFSKSTAGTHVFQCAPELMQTASITSLYIRKTAFGATPPKSIDVTYEYDDGTK
jgi:hypothetical protein